MKIMIGFLLGFAFAFAVFGDSARYGREVWADVLACERRFETTCDAVPQVIRIDKVSAERPL